MNPEWKKIAVELAKQAGEIMRRHFKFGIVMENKEDNSPLTLADSAINNLVVQRINKELPDHGIIAEEGGSRLEDTEFVWLCDPIDGTLNFSRNIPCCVFSLALLQNGNPVFGIVYDPFMGYLYQAGKDEGAALNEKQISVSPGKKGAWPIVGFSHWLNATYDTRKSISFLEKSGIHHMEIHSNIYMGMLVARGDLDGLIFPGINPWDTATIKIIVEEAGGKVTDLFGNDQRYDRETKGMIATNGILHDEVVGIVRECLKDGPL